MNVPPSATVLHRALLSIEPYKSRNAMILPQRRLSQLSSAPEPTTYLNDVRTGLFQYVQIPKIQAFMERGWMVVDPLDLIHGFWMVLMWHCDCNRLNHESLKSPQPPKSASEHGGICRPSDEMGKPI